MKLIMIFIYAISLMSSNNIGDNNKPQLLLLPQSEICINGLSSVNSFSLHYSFYDSPPILLTTTNENKKSTIYNIELKLPIDKFSCKNSLLRKDFKKSLKADMFPNIYISIDSFPIMNDLGSNLNAFDAHLSIAGQEGIESIHYKIEKKDDHNLVMYGSIIIDMKQYDIEVKNKLFGLIHVNDIIDIEFLFNFAIQ